MPHSEIQKQQKKGCLSEQQRSYDEVISYLNSNWYKSTQESMHALHTALGSIAPKIPSIIITGTSGKSITIKYLSKLLQTEGLTVGALSSPHFKLYNERLSINNNTISHEAFTQAANTVLNTMYTHKITASSKEILVGMSLLLFNKNVDVALIEQENILHYDPTMIYTSKILGITRIVTECKDKEKNMMFNILSNIKQNTHVVCADQSKLLLQKLSDLTKQKSGKWIMPIRKLAPLPYPYEQLHGRCAALAERIAHIYIDEFVTSNSLTHSNSLLRAEKKQRGRPRLTTKSTTSKNENSLESFWKNLDLAFDNRFQVISTKKHTIILNNASNIDAFNNLLLGIRLLNYQKPWKNISILIGTHQNCFNEHEFIKTMRYFFKKNSGNLTLCPVTSSVGEQQGVNWNISEVATAAQNAKIKVTTAKNFQSAYESIVKHLDDTQDLLVITGSQAILQDYWKYQDAN